MKITAPSESGMPARGADHLHRDNAFEIILRWMCRMIGICLIPFGIYHANVLKRENHGIV